MNIFNSMADKIRQGIRTWLRIQPAQIGSIQLNEVLDYEANAIKNRIWYRGESEELSQLYSQLNGDKTRFWAAKCTPGMEIRKIHVGIPSMIVDMLAGIVVGDMNIVDAGSRQQEWNAIADDNKFKELVKEAITETLYIGDGAFKVSFDTLLSRYPIIEFYPGDMIDVIRQRGRIKEIVFKTVYVSNRQEYVLLEHYGHGYITYELTKNGREYNIDAVPELAGLKNVTWNDNFMLAVPLMFYKSAKFKGRGKSIFDSKIDNFDALDEAWSQWMEALRLNKTKEYIPESMLPRDPDTGAVLKPNAFDNAYIQVETSMAEKAAPKIEREQSNIPHESYLATYITALDLCLQGIMSPSNELGNAMNQWLKEKGLVKETLEKGVQSSKIKLSNIEVRKRYVQAVADIKNNIDSSLPMEEKARKAFEARNRIRTQARDMMADEKTRKQLDTERPNKTFEELIQSKMNRKGMSREEAIQDIYKTATKTNENVNKELGLEGD